MSNVNLLRDVRDIPEHVTPGDLVMELASGTTAADQTIGDDVVTPQLVSALAIVPPAHATGRDAVTSVVAHQPYTRV